MRIKIITLFLSVLLSTVEALSQLTAKFIPIIVPVSGGRPAVQITPTAIPTSSFNSLATPLAPVRGTPPLSLTLALLGFCCIILLIFGVLALGILLRRENTQAGKNE